jgi:hypothetical protein
MPSSVVYYCFPETILPQAITPSQIWAEHNPLTTGQNFFTFEHPVSGWAHHKLINGLGVPRQ